MIGDGVNDVPALKQARLAVAMGSGAQVTKGVADVVLLEDEFARLPEAVAEGRRIARNIHRLGRLYLTKSVYAAALILLVAVPGFAFPFLPRHLTLAAFLTIGIPSFVLALAPSDGPLYRGRLLRALAAFAVPAGLATALGSILSFFLVDTVFGGSLEAGRTAATTTLIVLGLSFVLLLERGPGREHIAIQSYMLAMVARPRRPLRRDPRRCPGPRLLRNGAAQRRASGSSPCSRAAVGLTIASALWRLPQIERLERPLEAGETAEGLTPSTWWTSRPSDPAPARPLVARRQHELADDQVRRQAGLRALAAALHPDLDHDRALAGVKRLADGDDLVAEQAGGEDVELQLDRREVVAAAGCCGRSPRRRRCRRARSRRRRGRSRPDAGGACRRRSARASGCPRSRAARSRGRRESCRAGRPGRSPA